MSGPESRPIRLHCRRQGSGPALLFLHSLGSSSHTWAEQADRFADRFQVLAPDARGHGESDRPGGMTVDAVVCDLLALLDSLQIGQAVVVGQSMGGVAAVRLYQRAPERVRALVIGSMAASYPPEKIAERLPQARDAVASRGMRAVADQYAGSTLLAERHRPALAEVMGRMRPEDYLGILDSVFNTSVEEVLPAVQVPTLVYYGSEDWRTPRPMLEHIAGRIPGARFTLVPGAGHLCQLDNPDLFCTMLDDFLRSVSP